jgi:hypothetical protein
MRRGFFRQRQPRLFFNRQFRLNGTDSAALTFRVHSPNECGTMSATIIALVVVVAAMIVAIINGGPAPLEDDETTWP